MSLDLHRPTPPHRRRIHARTQHPHMSPYQNKLFRRKINTSMSAKSLDDKNSQNYQNLLPPVQIHKEQQNHDNIQAAKPPSPTPSSSSSDKLIFAPAEGQYLAGALERFNLNSDPFIQFHSWFEQASSYPGLTMPEATTLSTCELPSGRVSARVVYLKELDSKGFVIYSNWGTSRKSRDVNSNGHASLTFWWKELERQVRVEGITERLTSEQSQVYYDTRVRGSRIGAWASQQSSKLNGREELEEQVKEVERKFEGQEHIPVPEFWGGMRIIPTYIEFWQGRDSRLHDRFTYTRDSASDETWSVDRLSP